MPYWNCDSCGVRLYSASKLLRWRECPICEGPLARVEVVHSGHPGADGSEGGDERPDRELEDT